jgi:hypothetical protein
MSTPESLHGEENTVPIPDVYLCPEYSLGICNASQQKLIFNHATKEIVSDSSKFIATTSTVVESYNGIKSSFWCRYWYLPLYALHAPRSFFSSLKCVIDIFSLASLAALR